MRQMNTAFGTRASIVVWTDAALKQVSGVEGVAEVRERLGGGFLVFVDPRYDIEDIMQEIRCLRSDNAH